MFGLGGIGVEVFRDVSLRLMPFSKNDALAMMSEIRGAAMLSGFRNSPPVDRTLWPVPWSGFPKLPGTMKKSPRWI